MTLEIYFENPTNCSKWVTSACLSHHTSYKSESVEFCLSADSVLHENGVASFHEDQNEDDACLRDTLTYKRTFGYRDRDDLR